MKNLWVFLLVLFFSPVYAQYQLDIINAGSSWKYWDAGFTVPDSANWKTSTSYNTGSWGTGNAPLGYGDPVTTTIGYGGNPTNKHRTAYFRSQVTLTGYLDGGDTTISHPCAIYKLRVKRDDGIVVYVNGRIVFRDNIPLPFGFHTYAPLVTEGDTWQEIYIDPHIFHIGDNIIAVEVHQQANDSSDLFFDLELKAFRTLPFTQNAIIRNTDSWKYLDNDSDPGATWKNVGFSDASWLSGLGEFGFGEGDETTIINAGFITTYFRKTFNITSLDDFYRLRMKRDDGIVIYINGVEAFRENFNTYETISKATLASNAEDDGNVWNEIFLKNTGFVVGQNTIAVEMHQVSTGSSDLSFFFEIIGMKTATTFVTRGPYLQRAAPTSIKVMWNTSVASIGQVKYGTDPNNLSSTSSPTPSAIDHNVTLTGLTPNTKYYYSVETNTTILERTSDNLFITPPTTGIEKKTRIWAMGCFGSGKLPQRQVQERFLEQVHNNYVDMFLQLGDIAYADGSESDFQKNYFQVYQNYRTMKQTPIYNALGNHEYCNGTCYGNFAGIASKNIFETFMAAEAGGVASGEERYYSFNHGNIHVISIDAFGTESGTNFHIYDAGSLQKQWLINDLAANTQKWTIVIVHAPPYSKGKHDSDNPPAPGHNTEPEMIGVRSLVPLFDQYNVDLVLGSHSHNYERSKLIKNHTGNSDSYVPATHEVIGTNGKYDGTALNTCLYNKQTANKGTVYAVVGSGGRLETGVSSPWPHPAMAAAYDVTVQGSYLIEIEGSRMDVSWVTIDDVLINGDPIVKDRFTMMKDINLTAETVPVAIGIPTITLTAPWSGTFMWSNGATTQSITVAVTNTSYTVTDYSIACLSKIFTITTCPTINTLTNPITSGVLKYEVSQTLTATNIISSGANVSYDAGKAILLNPGFLVNNGSIFKAYIDGCGNF
ncbi:purple acid phosphatase family protein [Emticicia sp.]|uniref:purple acid phosphatase family protein n=1 Tax=Emticicia sp. TaxID=1930953 RepID=UPI0037500520